MQTTKKSVLTVDDEVFVFTLHRRTQTDADTQPRPDTDHRFLSLTPRPQCLPACLLPGLFYRIHRIGRHEMESRAVARCQ